MPFYEYECSACQFYVEALQKISEAPLRKCPSCGKQALKRLVSAPIFRLKGAGWYETDFKSDKEQKRNLAGREEGEARSSENGKAEAKPAETKAEAKPEAAKSASKPETRRRPVSRSSTARPAARPSKASKPARAVAKKPAARKKAVR